MGQAISVFVPMFLFMLTPVLIPVMTGVVGRIHDCFAGARKAPSAAARATEAARRNAADRRRESATSHRALAS